jgi:hypothetical protein
LAPGSNKQKENKKQNCLQKAGSDLLSFQASRVQISTSEKAGCFEQKARQNPTTKKGEGSERVRSQRLEGKV